ncbi:MAG: hypothetical protein U9N59_16615 [Campylobacterota bacterium]|nr:hypothetical protein [Campylobacterota bacterium]
MNIEIEIPLDVYFCPKCKILYHSSKDYIRVEHLGSIESKYKCNTCGEQFYNNQSFKNQKLIFRLNESILKKYNLYLNTEIRKYVTEYLNILTTNLLKIEPYSARDIARITKFNLKRIQPFYNTYKKEYQTPNRDKINKEFINIIDIDARNWIVDNNYDEKYNALKSDRAKQKILIMALLKIGCSTEVIRIFFDDNKPQTKEISEIRKNIFKRNKNPKLRYIIKNGYISQKVSIVNIHKYNVLLCQDHLT